MTMQKLCGVCTALNTEFNTAAKEMDSNALSAVRKKLAFRYDVSFLNGWTVRLLRHVSDSFTVEQMQVWTQTKKGLFGKRSGSRIILLLRTPAAPELVIRCTSTDAALAKRLRTGCTVKVSGEMEITAFLRAGDVVWKEAEFGKNVRVTVSGK